MSSQLTLFDLKTCLLRSECPNCGSKHGIITPSGNNYHVGKIHCADCNRFLKWVSKSEYQRALKMELVNGL